MAKGKKKTNSPSNSIDLILHAPAGSVRSQGVGSKKAKKGKGTNGSAAAPAAFARVMRTSNPRVSGSQYVGDGRIRVQHREYIGDVFGSTAFAVTKYPVNVGLAGTFTWLSGMANLFESYLFKSLHFEYETQRATSVGGAVMMALDFDASDANPTNKQTLMSYHNAVRTVVWQEMTFTADPPDLHKFGQQRYVRAGEPPAISDIKTFDVGNLFIATQGCVDTSAVGELYVCYDVELITPQTDLDTILNANCRKVVSGGGGIDVANIFGNAPVITGGLNVVKLTSVDSTLVFNKVGQYLLALTTGGTVMTDFLPTLTGTIYAATPARVTSLYSITDAAAASNSRLYIVSVLNVGETLKFNFTPSVTTLTSSVLRITPYSFSLA